MQPRFVGLRFRTSIDNEDALQGFLMMNASIEGIEELSNGTMQFSIPKEEWSEEFAERIASFASELGETEFLGSEELEERDWNAEWEASIEPQMITPDLVVTPSWKAEQAKSMGAKYLITIDPKMSFGTGHHETTRLCLAAMDHLDLREKTVLDIGTGSGILALYALLRGARNAVGLDNDPWSIENVQENRELNGFSHFQFEVRGGTLEQTIKGEEQFDIILANIHRNVLVDIAADIRHHSSAYGYVILSGLLIYDVAEVKPAYEAAGFHFVRESRENEWACLTFKV